MSGICTSDTETTHIYIVYTVASAPAVTGSIFVQRFIYNFWDSAETVNFVTTTFSSFDSNAAQSQN